MDAQIKEALTRAREVLRGLSFKDVAITSALEAIARTLDTERAPNGQAPAQPAPAAQDDAKDAAQLYPVVIDGLLWLCTKRGGTFKPVDDCAAVNPPLSWKNALAANKKEPT